MGTATRFFGMEFGMRIFATPAVMLASLPIRRKDPNAQMAFVRVLPAHLLALLALEKIFLKKRLTDGGEYDILSVVQKLRLTQSSYNFILGNCVTAAPTTLTRIV